MKTELSIERTLEAPQRVVWEAWLDPTQWAAWLGPAGFQVEVVQHDGRVGGKWRIRMVAPSGDAFIFTGEYLELTAPHTLATTWVTQSGTRTVIRVELIASGSHTRMCFTQTDVPAADAPGYRTGWEDAFDKLRPVLVPRTR